MKISVVIPARNRAHTLPACLDSVLNQTLPPDEVIVVDDGSTDGTSDFLAQYSERGVRCIALAQPSGAQTARNKGVEAARNDWIAFQDSDDLWLPEKLSLQVETLKTLNFNKRMVIHCNGFKLNAETQVNEPLPMPKTQGSCYKQLLVTSAPMFQGMLVAKEALIQMGGLDERCPAYQEWDTAIRLSKICDFVHLQKPLFQWVWHNTETISKDAMRDVRGFQYVIEKHKRAILEMHGERGWRLMLAMNICRALDYSLWDEITWIVRNEPFHPLFLLAKIFAHRRIFPRGAGRLIRLITL